MGPGLLLWGWLEKRASETLWHLTKKFQGGKEGALGRHLEKRVDEEAVSNEQKRLNR